LTNPKGYGIRNLEVSKMAKDIIGMRNLALKLGVSLDRIRRLIFIKKIRPKKEIIGGITFYKFSPHDQEVIRSHTSMKD